MRGLIDQKKHKDDLAKIWSAYILKAILVVFLAGMGWERLSAVERAIESAAEQRVIERIAVLETKLDLVLVRLSGVPP